MIVKCCGAKPSNVIDSIDRWKVKSVKCGERAEIRSISTFRCGGCCCKEHERPGGVPRSGRGCAMWRREAAEMAAGPAVGVEDLAGANIMTSTEGERRPGAVISTIPIPLRNIRPTLRATWTGAPPPRNSRQIAISRPTVCRARAPGPERDLRRPPALASPRRSVRSATTRFRPARSSTRCSTANTTPADAAWRTT